MSVLVEKVLVLIISIFLAVGALAFLVSEVIPMLQKILEACGKEFMKHMDFAHASDVVRDPGEAGNWNT